MTVISENYNETYNKPTTIVRSNLVGNIHISFLLLMITLHFTFDKRKNW